MSRTCENCEFNFPFEIESRRVCAGHGSMPEGHDTFGWFIDDLKCIFPDGCDDWKLSYEEFLRRNFRL